ncbi:probable serine/threonine-protein kinase tsuA [Arachis ipaensis]|uniref:probable serine/threonine-protein kinase tsuA n=1 Tax=Arachis ipaensis TaxID=130454 RepID=UPI0007AF18F7|nr:probable serine/threonine-protein kinase tsuA [Arachis ipaensis]
MAKPRRITLHEQGAPDLILQPLQARYPNLDPNFELKNSLINLLPKYHGLPGQDPIRHLRDFQVACSTARRHGADEIAIMVFAFPFSLEGSAKEWFYFQPEEVVTEWDLLKREFLDKFFPPEKTDYIQKEISSIMQIDQETLYEYWTQLKRLLESCPHHGLDTHLLISYFTGGLCAADKRLFSVSSGGSLSKNKMAAEAWSLINDVAKDTQHVRVRNNPPKSMVEAPPSESALTKVLGDMTTLLTEIRKEQKAFQSIQAIQAPPQILQLKGPPRVCGLCSSTAHYTDQCHQVQEGYTLAVANVNYNNLPPYQSQGQSNYSHGNSFNQGWRDNAQGSNHNQRWNQGNSSSHYYNNNQPSSQYHNNTNQNQHNQPYQHSQQNHNNNHRYQTPHQRQQTNQPSSSPANQGDDSHRVLYQEQERLRAMIEKNEEKNRTLNTQVSTMSAQMSSIAKILSRLTLPPTTNTNTNQASSSSNLPSQPLPNPKGSINAITLRSGTMLEEVEPKPIKLAADVPNVEVGETMEINEDDKEKKVAKEEEEQLRAKEPKRQNNLEEQVNRSRRAT